MYIYIYIYTNKYVNTYISLSLYIYTYIHSLCTQTNNAMFCKQGVLRREGRAAQQGDRGPQGGPLHPRGLAGRSPGKRRGSTPPPNRIYIIYIYMYVCIYIYIYIYLSIYLFIYLSLYIYIYISLYIYIYIYIYIYT